jgi:hypothetical protein
MSISITSLISCQRRKPPTGSRRTRRTDHLNIGSATASHGNCQLQNRYCQHISNKERASWKAPGARRCLALACRYPSHAMKINDGLGQSALCVSSPSTATSTSCPSRLPAQGSNEERSTPSTNRDALFHVQAAGQGGAKSRCNGTRLRTHPKCSSKEFVPAILAKKRDREPKQGPRSESRCRDKVQGRPSGHTSSRPRPCAMMPPALSTPLSTRSPRVPLVTRASSERRRPPGSNESQGERGSIEGLASRTCHLRGCRATGGTFSAGLLKHRHANTSERTRCWAARSQLAPPGELVGPSREETLVTVLSLRDADSTRQPISPGLAGRDMSTTPRTGTSRVSDGQLRREHTDTPLTD